VPYASHRIEIAAQIASQSFHSSPLSPSSTEKNGFVTATKLGTTYFFFAATKNFATATKRLVDRTKHLVVVTKCFCYPYFNK